MSVFKHGRRLRLLQEPLLGRLGAGEVRREELDGDLALQPRVMGGVDDAHPAVAQFGEDRIRAEGGAWGETSYVFSQENSSGDLTDIAVAPSSPSARSHRIRRLLRHREDDLETQFDSAAQQNGTP